MEHLANIGLIGAGNMGSALIKGMVKAGAVAADSSWIYDIDSAKTDALAREIFCHAAASHEELAHHCDTIILASKPKEMPALLDSLSEAGAGEKLIITIAAGIPLSAYLKRLGEGARVIRVMPNTPAMIGCGAAGLSRSGAVTDRDMQVALRIFQSVGMAIEVEENLLDAVTGLSGSGPAYVFYMIESLAKAGQSVGLPPNAAANLAMQTVLGAARMAAESGEDPAELRRKVTSPNGTTEAGIRVLTEEGFADLITRCVKAATDRSRELGKLYD